MAFLEPVIEAVNEVAGDVAGGGTIIKLNQGTVQQPGQTKPADSSQIPASPPFGLPRGPTVSNPLYYKNWSKLWGDVFGGSTHHQTGSSVQDAFNKQTLQALGNITVALSSITDMLGDLELSDEDLRNRVLPEIEAALNTFATQVSGTSSAYALQLFGVAEGNLSRVEADLVSTIKENVATLQHTIAATATAENGYVSRVEADLVSTIKENVATLQHTIAATATALNDNIARVEADLVSTIKITQADLEAQVTKLNDNLGQLKTDTQAEIATGIQTAEGFATGLVGGLATSVLQQITPQLQALQAEQDECLEPLCDTVTPNASQLGKLGNLIKSLEGLVAGGLLAGLLVAAVEDPAGTAADVVDLTGWVTPLAVDLADAVGLAING